MISMLILAAAVATTPPQMVLPDEQPAYDAVLRKHARDADTTFGGSPCPTATATSLTSEPVVVAGHPEFAARHERLRVTGCGRTSIQNINVGRFGGDPPWQMVAGLPGDSLASLELQQSTWPAALAQAATNLPPNCRAMVLQDLSVVARPGNVDFAAPGGTPPDPIAGRIGIALPPEYETERARLDLTAAWAEIWPIQLCGQDRTTGVVFVPLKDHTASAYLFLPFWQQTAAQGPAAAPAVPPATH